MLCWNGKGRDGNDCYGELTTLLLIKQRETASARVVDAGGCKSHAEFADLQTTSRRCKPTRTGIAVYSHTADSMHSSPGKDPWMAVSGNG